MEDKDQHEVLQGSSTRKGGLYFPKKTQNGLEQLEKETSSLPKHVQEAYKASPSVQLSQVSSGETADGRDKTIRDDTKNLLSRHAHKRKRLESTPSLSSESVFSGVVGKRPPAISKKYCAFVVCQNTREIERIVLGNQISVRNQSLLPLLPIIFHMYASKYMP